MTTTIGGYADKATGKVYPSYEDYLKATGYTGSEGMYSKGIQVPASIEQTLKELQEKVSGITKKVAEEGITSDTGQVLLPPTINAGDIKDTTAVDVGNLPVLDNKSVSSLTTATAGLPSIYQKAYEDWLKQKTEAEKAMGVDTTKGESMWTKMIKGIKGKPTADVAGAQATAQAQYQVPEWLKKTQEQSVKVAALQGEIDKINVLQLQEIDRARAQLANVPTYIIDRQENQINREYASQKAYKAAELGGEAALLKAYSGNLTEARNLANDAVNAYTYDIQQKRADFDSLYNIYGDWIASLDKEQKSILDNARTEAIRQEDNAKKDAAQVMEWALKYPNAGIKITDTLAKANEKAMAVAPTEKPSIFGSAEGGYYQQVYNPTTGKWETQQVMAGTGGGISGLTQSGKEGLASELVEVQKYTDKETAQADFDKLKDSYLVQYGQAGVDKIQESINKLPSKGDTGTQKTNILTNAKSWISGQIQELKSFFGKIKVPQVKLPSSTEVYIKGVETVVGKKEQLGTTGQSFFTKLFGF